MSRFAACPRCKGERYRKVFGRLYTPCKHCDGTGQVLSFWARLWLFMTGDKDGEPG